MTTIYKNCEIYVQHSRLAVGCFHALYSAVHGITLSANHEISDFFLNFPSDIFGHFKMICVLSHTNDILCLCGEKKVLVVVLSLGKYGKYRKSFLSFLNFPSDLFVCFKKKH